MLPYLGETSGTALLTGCRILPGGASALVVVGLSIIFPQDTLYAHVCSEALADICNEKEPQEAAT